MGEQKHKELFIKTFGVGMFDMNCTCVQWFMDLWGSGHVQVLTSLPVELRCCSGFSFLLNVISLTPFRCSNQLPQSSTVVAENSF